MFKSDKFYIFVGNKSLIIRKEGKQWEKVIDFMTFIPNVPFYYHFFDEDNNYMDDMKIIIKEFAIKNATIFVPDDSINIGTDMQVLTEFFKRSGVKKVGVESQCFPLSLDKKYISISRTTRAIVLQYIVNNKSITKKYYDKNYTDIAQIHLDAKNLHTDCLNESVPIYINNINNDLQPFQAIGKLVSLNDFVSNIGN